VISVFGEKGMDQLIDARENTMRANYTEAMRGARSLKTRLERLAEIRSREGYMAEFRPEGEGFLFIENHCPICTAARACTGFCRSELQLFDEVLGSEVTVSRVEHVLAGARRCAYQVSPKPRA
jgi:predicted ArsR family transcriptional regulator